MMRRFLAIALVGTLLACDDDEPTNNGALRLPATYVLQSIDGTALPAPLVKPGDPVNSVTSDTLTFDQVQYDHSMRGTGDGMPRQESGVVSGFSESGFTVATGGLTLSGQATFSQGSDRLTFATRADALRGAHTLVYRRISP